MRRLLSKLARRGVVSASGCVIKTFAALSGPPAGYDRVRTRMAEGYLPVGDAEDLCIQGTVAAEAMAIVRDQLPNEFDTVYAIETDYALRGAEGTVSLGISVYGLAIHMFRVFLT